MPYNYLKDPEDIYKQSFALIEKECDFSGLPASLHRIAQRMVHSCAMPSIIADLAWHGDPGTALKDAFQATKPIIADARMVISGLNREAFKDYPLHCVLDEKNLADISRSEKTTRSSSGIGLWRDRWENGIIVIGNAPTALFRLLEELESGAPKPAIIIALPIGFVGAAESKEALMQSKIDIPFLTLKGRFGGSALAAAALNAIGVNS